MNKKVRLVRCPRCRLVLPELAEFPVYKCGGCGAVLQAKNRERSSVETSSSLPDMVSVPTAENDSEEPRENQQIPVHSGEEPARDEETERSMALDGRGTCCTDDSCELRSLTELSSHETAESSPEAGACVVSDEDNSLTRVKITDENARGSVDFFDESDEEDCSLNHRQRMKKNARGSVDFSDDANEGRLGNVNFPDEICSSSELERGENRPHSDLTEIGGNEFGGSSSEFPVNTNRYSLSTSSAELADNAARDRDVEAQQKSKNHSTFKSLIAEKLLHTKPAKSAGSGDTDTFRWAQYENQSFDYTQERFDRASFETSEKQSSDLGIRFNDVSKSPANGTYYNYSGSESDASDASEDIHLVRSKRRSPAGAKWLPKNALERGKIGTGYYLHRARHDAESEKAELLRIVRELQDQINLTDIAMGNESRAEVSRKGKETASYYDDLPTSRDLNSGRYPLRHSQGKFWSQQHEPLPLEKPKFECSCDLRYRSELLPRHVIGGYSGTHRCLIHYSPLRSDPWSSRPNFSSNSKIHNRFHTKESSMLFEKIHHPKRHFLPIAGGAPIVACHGCTELIQLPVHFLLFRKRCYGLKCGACSKLLKFSLRKGTHLAPYSPEATVPPPPSEADECARRIEGSRVSYSDECGPSFSMSGSTATDPSSAAPPFRAFDRNSSSRIVSSASSHKPIEERTESVLEEKKPGKKSSEIVEIGTGTVSPLHRLMGYSSPSKLTLR